MNKLSNDLCLVVPWFLVRPEETWDEDYEVDGYSIALTAVTRVGWLVENGHEVFFGMPSSVKQQFEDLGEL